MRWVWSAGGLHALIGTTIIFLTLHPWRGARDAHALALCRVGSAGQTFQGLALMIAGAATRMRLAPGLIAAGTAVAAAVISHNVFTGGQPPWIVAVPIGGSIATLGWRERRAQERNRRIIKTRRDHERSGPAGDADLSPADLGLLLQGPHRN
jgi:hypothetical protein